MNMKKVKNIWMIIDKTNQYDREVFFTRDNARMYKHRMGKNYKVVRFTRKEEKN